MAKCLMCWFALPGKREREGKNPLLNVVGPLSLFLLLFGCPFPVAAAQKLVMLLLLLLLLLCCCCLVPSGVQVHFCTLEHSNTEPDERGMRKNTG